MMLIEISLRMNFKSRDRGHMVAESFPIIERAYKYILYDPLRLMRASLLG